MSNLWTGMYADRRETFGIEEKILMEDLRYKFLKFKAKRRVQRGQ